MGFPFVDLFAGIGGFHAALSALGGSLAQAAELDERAAAVYQHNWGVDPYGDVVKLAQDPGRAVEKHVLLAGGFPCQPFSKSGQQRGINEERGRLFDEVLKIVVTHQPAVVVLENVRNIAGPRQRHVWNHVVDSLRAIGYAVPRQPTVFSPHLLAPALGGSPQVRDRVYIIGTYVGPAQVKRFVDLSPLLERKPTPGWSPHDWRLGTLLEPTHLVANRPGCRLDKREVRWIEVWNDFLRRTRGVELPGHPLWSSYWHLDAAVDPTAPTWKQRYEQQNIDFYRANRQSVDAWLRRHGNELRSFPPSRQKLEWQAQDMPRDLRLGLLHFRPSGIRVKKATYTPALVAMAQTPVYGPERRRHLDDGAGDVPAGDRVLRAPQAEREPRGVGLARHQVFGAAVQPGRADLDEQSWSPITGRGPGRAGAPRRCRSDLGGPRMVRSVRLVITGSARFAGCHPPGGCSLHRPVRGAPGPARPHDRATTPDAPILARRLPIRASVELQPRRSFDGCVEATGRRRRGGGRR